MKARSAAGEWFEKAIAGQWSGCNSTKMPWLMPDTQFRWGVNTVCRGGIPQTRPGYLHKLTLPTGNLQGCHLFTPTKSDATIGECIAFAVDGNVYAAPFPLTQPRSWEPYRLKNIVFAASAKNVYWEVAEKSTQTSDAGDISIVPTYSVLMMQDGISRAAFFDGKTNGQVNENDPDYQTPTGTWMKWTGDRLWVARGNYVLASDLGDPISFLERIQGEARGDFKFTSEVTGLATTTGTNRLSQLIAYTIGDASTLKSYIENREEWATTSDFQTLLYPSLGCVAGRSIINHAGLLWWYSEGGLVSSDSAQAIFLTSETKYRDIEMGNSKRNLAPDLSGICAFGFENYLGFSVPSGDPLNAHTMILDYAIANELTEQAAPAWNGVWTGTRPVEWAVGRMEGQRRVFQASVDYQELGGSFNHIWEAFQSNRMDTYSITDDNNVTTTVNNPIYCSWESKLLGDGMDLKRFLFAEIDAVEIGGEVNVKVSVGGNKGAYIEILRKKIIATLNSEGSSNADLKTLDDAVGPFRVQTRRLVTSNSQNAKAIEDNVESRYSEIIDKSFGLYVQWCGRFGIESARLYMEPLPEKSNGSCEKDESGINVLTEDGQSFKFTS